MRLLHLVRWLSLRCITATASYLRSWFLLLPPFHILQKEYLGEFCYIRPDHHWVMWLSSQLWGWEVRQEDWLNLRPAWATEEDVISKENKFSKENCHSLAQFLDFAPLKSKFHADCCSLPPPCSLSAPTTHHCGWCEPFCSGHLGTIILNSNTPETLLPKDPFHCCFLYLWILGTYIHTNHPLTSLYFFIQKLFL